MENPLKIGILGLGTVGSGVVKSHEGNDLVSIKKVAVRNINKKRSVNLPVDVLTEDSFSVVNDKDIDVVVELIGGTDPAYELVKTAIENKKHVVSANKELIATYGKELFELAKKNNVIILYEAAVAGGIPIIMPIKTSLCGNKVTKVAGILNGTTNYILTKMTDEGADFAETLKQAQELGYAEADPTADVEGFDAAYKISILASIVFNQRIDVKKVYREGISKITSTDIQYADELGYKIKLIAKAELLDGGSVDIRVHPMLVSKKQMISRIDDVLNAVMVEGFPVGQVIFSGPGAGEFPTASSVIGDILCLAQEMEAGDKNPLAMMQCKHETAADILDIKNSHNKYYINLTAENVPGVIGKLGEICGKNNINFVSILQKGILENDTARVIILTSMALEADIQKAVEEMTNSSIIKDITNVIRVMD